MGVVQAQCGMIRIWMRLWDGVFLGEDAVDGA